MPKIKIAKAQQRTIKTLSRQGVRQSAIARLLHTDPGTIAKWQKRLGLPTKVRMDEKEVLNLSAQGWSAERIAARYSRKPAAVAALLRVHHSRNARKQREQNQMNFRAAIRLRQGTIRDLALKFHIPLYSAYRISHAVFPHGNFRPGPTRAQNLPLAAAEPKAALAEPPDTATTALTVLFNKYNNGSATPPEYDSQIVTMFLRFVPESTPDVVTNKVAYDLVRAMHCLRRQAQGQWIH